MPVGMAVVILQLALSLAGEAFVIIGTAALATLTGMFCMQLVRDEHRLRRAKSGLS